MLFKNCFRFFAFKLRYLDFTLPVFVALFKLQVVVSLVDKLEWISHFILILNNNSLLLLNTLFGLLNFLLSNRNVLKLLRFALLFKLQISLNFITPLHSDCQILFNFIETNDDTA